jgi:hypothetical protein
MIQENDYFIMIMFFAPVLTFFACAGLLSIIKNNSLN